MVKFLKIIGRILLIFVFIIVILAGVFFGVTMAKYDGDWKKTLTAIGTWFFGEAETRYVLVMGVSEDISTPLTDTIMLAGYNPKTQKAFVLSIPRDTFIGENQNSAKASQKINAQYKKGTDVSVKEVEELVGIDIDNYVVIKTSMLVDIVDTIGGVEFDVPIDMEYDDPTQDLHINLKAGKQTINGDKAEQLLRFRHNNDGSSYSYKYGDNDFGRMRTQREFIKATASQLLNIKNVGKINDLIEDVSSNLETDLTTEEMLTYVPSLISFNTEDLVMEQLQGETRTLNKISFFLANDNAKEQVNVLVNNMMSE